VIQQAVVVENSAEWVGGGVHLVGSKCTLRNSTFDSNVAAKAGGAIYVEYNGLHADSTDFFNNTASTGGALEVYQGSSVSESTIVVNSRFENNVADYGGGAICATNSGLSIKSTEFFNNTAAIGGAATVYNKSRVDFANCTLVNNTARPLAASGDPLKTGVNYTLGVGGALCVDNSSVTITSSKVWGNIALVDGGECRDSTG
jgi:predicted outer membrane repeat protein